MAAAQAPRAQPPRARPSRALVTGSSSGIGAAISRNLLAAGWWVQGLDRASADIEHARFEACTVDLLDPTATALHLQAALAGSTPQALVHAAGVLRPAPLGQLNAADGQLMWQLHVQAATQLANAVLPAMAQAGSGRVVLIGSRISTGMPGRSQYAATKAALVALARSWAAEVATRGVTVNVVSPAATATAMLNSPSRLGSAPRLPPIGRLIQPEEVAALVAYLLSPEAAAITGQDIAICGGATLPL